MVAYQVARTLGEVEAALAAAEEEPLIIAGGTDVMVRARDALRDRPVLDVARVVELRRIAVEGAELCLGAAVTYAECLTDPTIRRGAPLLAEVAKRFASPQIRNVATLGGNVANASPAGDGVAALWALDATVEALTPDGPMRRPLAEVVVGPGRLALPRRSLITEVRLAVAEPGDGTGFYKLVNRAWPEHPMAISLASVAVRLHLDAAGRVALARIVLGAVAPTPVRAATAEATLLGHVPTSERIGAAAARTIEAARPISDIRGGAQYRLDVLPALVTTAIERAVAAARRSEADRV